MPRGNPRLNLMRHYKKRELKREVSFVELGKGIDKFNPMPETPRDTVILPIDQSLVTHYAEFGAAAIQLDELGTIGAEMTQNTPLYFAKLLQQEIPTRFAKRIRDIESLPFEITPSWAAVKSCYEQSFARVVAHPEVKTVDQEEAFRAVVHDLKVRHKGISQQIAMALQELGAVSAGDTISTGSFNFASFLDKFYTSRVAMRVLTGQYIAVMEQSDSAKEDVPRKKGVVGLISKNCCPGNIAAQAANDASALVTYYYGDAPEVNILGSTKLEFAYIPAHLHYIIFELLKNSMRATIEKHENSGVLPPIDIVVAEGEDEVAIKISDQGGGISRAGMDRIWSYTYTTAAPEVLAPDSGTTTAPIAGFGHGLPLSRLYARCF